MTASIGLQHPQSHDESGASDQTWGQERPIHEAGSIDGNIIPFESIVGTPKNDDITGTADYDDINVSQGGNDTVHALGGDDAIYFGAAFTSRDFVDGGDGYDAVELYGTYAKTITLNASDLQNVEEVLCYGGYTYSVKIASDLVSAGHGITIYGFSDGTDTPTMKVDGSASAGNLAFYGGAHNDVLTGGSGDDYMDVSQGGNDTVSGGAGDDTFQFGATFDEHDHVNGGTGVDVVQISGGFSGTLDFEKVEALYVNGGATYQIKLSADMVPAGAGFGISAFDDDTGSPTLVINGSAAKGDLSLFGGDNADVLEGGSGHDLLIGYGGADTFYFVAGSGKDTIGDFTVGQDVVRIAVSGVKHLSDLTIKSDGESGALVRWADGSKSGAQIDLLGVDPSSLSGADFKFGKLPASAPDDAASHGHHLAMFAAIPLIADAHHLVLA